MQNVAIVLAVVLVVVLIIGFILGMYSLELGGGISSGTQD